MWRSAEERIFKKANQELAVLKKKIEEKDQSDTRWHHLPKISFFSIKSMSIYYFYEQEKNEKHL